MVNTGTCKHSEYSRHCTLPSHPHCGGRSHILPPHTYTCGATFFLQHKLLLRNSKVLSKWISDFSNLLKSPLRHSANLHWVLVCFHYQYPRRGRITFLICTHPSAQLTTSLLMSESSRNYNSISPKTPTYRVQLAN